MKKELPLLWKQLLEKRKKQSGRVGMGGLFCPPFQFDERRWEKHSFRWNEKNGGQAGG